MRLEGARLDSAYGGVVPIAIQARDLAVHVEAYDVSVGDPSDLTLFYEVRDIRRHRSTDQRLHYDGVLFGLDHLDDFGPEVGDGLRKAAPNLVKAATDRHDTVLSVGDISPLSPNLYSRSLRVSAPNVEVRRLAHGQNHPKSCLSRHHPCVGFGGSLERHGLHHGRDVGYGAEPERRVAGRWGPCQRPFDS